MTTYTIITQQQYAGLLKNYQQFKSENNTIQQSNMALRQELQLLKGWLKILRDQVRTEKSQNLLLLAHLRLQSSKLHQSHINLTQSTQSLIQLRSQFNQSILDIQTQKVQKTQLYQQNLSLSQQLLVLQRQISATREVKAKLSENQERIQDEIRELRNKCKQGELQNTRLLKQISLKRQNQISLNQQLNLLAQHIQNVALQHNQCKQQKDLLQAQVLKYKQSPIQKLQKQILAKESWIEELTKTIGELRQRCVQLEMRDDKVRLLYKDQQQQGLSNNNAAHVIANATSLSLFIHQRQRQQQQQRTKYVSICRQLAKQFSSRLGKINQQKKSLQQKYHSIRLRLNQYQYNEFCYKDRINLYVQKIERFQKLTIKQQQQMQRLIEQFDSQLNDMLRRKEHQIKMKFQEEIERYQLQLQRIKDNGQQRVDQLENKKDNPSEDSRINCDAKDQHVKKSAFPHLQKSEEENRLSLKLLNLQNPFEHQLLHLQIQELKIQLNQKQHFIEQLNKLNHSLKKQIEKVKHSKNIYKQKSAQFQEQSYQKSTELRRYKTIVQELCHQMDIKTNELQIVKRQFLKISSAQYFSPFSIQQSNQEVVNQSLSAKLSSNEKNRNQNRRHTLQKQHNSLQYEYQVSEIDTEGQRRNESVLDSLIVDKMGCYNNIFRRGDDLSVAAGSSIQYGNGMNPRNHTNSVISSSSLINTSQMSSSVQSLSQYTNSPNNSSLSQSQNSYQSYGIKYLYSEKLSEHGKRFLMHKNSLH